MTKIDRREVDKKDFVVVKDKRTLDVTRVIAPHELQIGLEGYKRASLRIEGDEHITGKLTIDGGCKGVLKLLDGTCAVKAGTGTLVSSSPDGSVTVSLDTNYLARRDSGVEVSQGSGLVGTPTADGKLSLSIDPGYLSTRISAGNGVSVSNSSGLLTLSLNVVAGSGISLSTSNGQVEISATGNGGGSESVFEEDIIVSLSNGKTFGRYATGQTIPATGKTAAEVIQMASVEPINPTVSLTSPTSIEFNQTNVSNTINFSHVINSLNASIASARLEWRRGGSGSWTTLTASTSSSSTFTHTLTDTSFNAQSFDYRYTVTDSVGATATATLSITPAAYLSPTISLNVLGNNLTQVETSLKREKGNVSSTLSGTITRRSSRVNLVSYTLQYSTDGSNWVNIGSSVNIGPGNSSINSTTHNDLNLKASTSIRYRVLVVDTYQQHLGSVGVLSGVTVVAFLNLIFFGPVAQAPQNSSGVRMLVGKIFTDGENPFTINTGTDNRMFSFAVPAGTSIVSVIDVDALNANITTSYVKSTFNVLDAGSTATSYDVYTMINAEPYSPNSHAHRVAR